MHVTDPTGIPLNVRGFDGKVIGALHNGKIVEILRTSAETTGKPWSYAADETNGGVGFIGKRIVGAGDATEDLSVSRSDRDIDRQVQLDETGLKQRHGQ